MNQQKTTHKCRTTLIAVVLVAMLLSMLPVAAGAAGGLTMSTVYTGLNAKAGATMNYPLVFENTGEGDEVALKVVKIPEGWKSFFYGNSTEVSHIFVGKGTLSGAIAYNVQIPWDTKTGTYEILLRAEGDTMSADLTLVLHVTEEELGNSTLDVLLEKQEGDAGSAYSFTTTIQNNTPNEQSYNLSAQAPSGWSVAFKADDTRVAAVTIGARGSKGVSVEVTPDSKAEAGTYTIPIAATSATEKLESVVTVVITGSYELEVSTPNDLLSFDATANKESSFTLTVTNTGNAKLTNLTMRSSVPKGWTITYSQSTIDALEAGASVDITVYVTPTKDALTGDYSVTVEARNGQAQDKAEFRVTVKTETMWGITGISLIGLALIGLWFVFQKYGRR